MKAAQKVFPTYSCVDVPKENSSNIFVMNSPEMLLQGLKSLNDRI
jgi:hypothetical protein